MPLGVTMKFERACAIINFVNRPLARAARRYMCPPLHLNAPPVPWESFSGYGARYFFLRKTEPSQLHKDGLAATNDKKAAQKAAKKARRKANKRR